MTAINAVGNALTGATGTGNFVGATSATLITPALGTPSSGTLTSCTGLPISTGVSGLGTGIATALGTNANGTGAISLTTSPTFVTPILGVAAATSINFGVSSLSTYIDSGTFTPTLTFGGASVGLTYTIQSGTYNQIGGVVFFNIVLAINALGSSTGNALINGLPVAARGASGSQFVNVAGSAVVFVGQLIGIMGAATTSVIPLTMASGAGQTQLTNTAFINGSIIWVSGSYLI